MCYHPLDLGRPRDASMHSALTSFILSCSPPGPGSGPKWRQRLSSLGSYNVTVIRTADSGRYHRLELSGCSYRAARSARSRHTHSCRSRRQYGSRGPPLPKGDPTPLLTRTSTNQPAPVPTTLMRTEHLTPPRLARRQVLRPHPKKVPGQHLTHRVLRRMDPTRGCETGYRGARCSSRTQYQYLPSCGRRAGATMPRTRLWAV